MTNTMPMRPSSSRVVVLALAALVAQLMSWVFGWGGVAWQVWFWLVYSTAVVRLGGAEQRRRRWWRTHTDLAGLIDAFTAAVEDLPPGVPLRSRSTDGQQVTLERRSMGLGLRKELLRRVWRPPDTVLFNADLTAGRVAVVAVDEFVITVTGSVLLLQDAFGFTRDETGDVVAVPDTDPSPSLWARLRTAASLVTSGYAYAREPDLREAVAQIRLASGGPA